jgi:hypothetical protein
MLAFTILVLGTVLVQCVVIKCLRDISRQVDALKREQEHYFNRSASVTRAEGDNLMKIYKQLHAEVKNVREQLSTPKTN